MIYAVVLFLLFNALKIVSFEKYDSGILKKFVYFDDVVEDSSDWKNKCFADYYHFDKVKLIK